MKTWISVLYASIVFVLAVLFFPNQTLAAVNVSDVNSVLDGLITQQQINQTNKPQYSDFNGSNELVDPNTGKLTWKRTDIQLPGRDGLDLNIGIMYDSNNAFSYMRNSSSNGFIKKYNYLNSRYDLGIGWSFQFPSIQLADGYLYYHKGDGAVYRIEFNSTNSLEMYTHLVGYQGKDIKLMQDQGSFNNGQATSTYYLEYADKKREYFASDGRVLGIVDRFGNKLVFQHADRQMYDGQTYKVISSITDTLGRVVTFTYDSTLQTTGSFNGEQLVVAVKDLNGNVNQSVTYMKWRNPLIFNGNPDGFSPYLWSVENQNHQFTYYNYELTSGSFDYTSKYYSNYTASNTYKKLIKVTSPRSTSTYEYEKATRNIGGSGIAEEFRVTKRYDQLFKNGAAVGDYNHVNYTYEGDYTGYPIVTITDNALYSSTSTIQSASESNGISNKTVFNGKGQTLSTEVRAANGEKKVTTNYEFHSIFTSLPLRTQLADYGIGDNDSSANKLFILRQYTDWGELQSETQPLTQAQLDDSNVRTKYTTTYTYEPTYYFLQKKTWYQNLTMSTPLSETYDYYSNGRLKSVANANNEITSYCYDTLDANNNLISNCSDPNIQIAGKVNKVKISKALENGKVSVSETSFGPETQYAYPSEAVSYFTTVNGSGQSVTQAVKTITNYDPATGLLKDESDGNGRKTSYTYDLLGRELTITYPTFTNLSGEQYDVTDSYIYLDNRVNTNFDSENLGTSSLSVHSYRDYTRKSTGALTRLSEEYSYYNGLGAMIFGQQYDSTKAQWLITQYHYDDIARPVYSIDPMSNTATVSYNVWGDQKEGTDSYGNLYISENNLKARRNINYLVATNDVQAYRSNTSQASLKSNYVEQEFDPLGNLVLTRAYKDWPSQGQPVTELYAYDIVGNLTTYTDPKRNLNNEGVTNKNTYDALNRLSKVKDALGQITNYTYDGNSQLTNMTVQSNESDAPKTISTRVFTENGLLASKTDPNASSTSYSYNNLGQLQQSRDRNGSVFSYEYDEQYRQKLLTVSNNGNTQQMRSIIGSNGIMADTFEKYTNGTKTSSMTTGIDNLKRMKSIAIQGTNYSAQLGISYDADSRVSSLVGNNTAVNYKYNKLRLDSVQTDGQTVMNDGVSANVKYTYYPNGKIETISYPPLADGSVLVTRYTYDALNNLRTMTNKKGDTLLSSYTYAYDVNGNVVSAGQTVINQGATLSEYTYDKLNRLATVSRTDRSIANYAYDLKGNRLTFNSTEIPVLNEMNYTYDLFNTLTSVSKGGATTSFDYSPDGMRYKKSTGTSTTQYRYNQNGEVIAEANGSNQTTATYVRGDRLLVKKEIASAKEYYYLYNGHGDVVQIIDRNGTVMNAYTYDEWGNMMQQSETIPNSFKYAGEVYDNETGLYYLRARYYDPSMGRFINEDAYEGQITNPLSLNLYTYVQNNPLGFVDPSGNDRREIELMLNHADEFEKDLKKTFKGIYKNDTNQYTYLYNMAAGKNGVNEGQQKWARSQLLGSLDAGQANFDRKIGYASLALDLVSGVSPAKAGVATTSKVLSKAGKVVAACNCFTAGTKVLTDEGEKNIEDIQVGDKVLSKDEETGEVAYKEVTATFNHETDEIYKISVGGQTIESTFNHPFYVQGKGWTFVKDLEVGNLLVQSDGNTLKIDSIELEHKQVTVYNMTVDEFHTYFVSDLGIWVHNTNCDILDWSIISKKGETRVDHVGKHSVENTARDNHGVFVDNPTSVLNEAWSKRSGIIPTVDGNVEIWRIPYPNAGLAGGKNDYGDILNYVEIITEKGTNKIITGYPAK